MNSWVVTVDVDDCQSYLDRALELGATVALPLAAIPGVGSLAYIKDRTATSGDDAVRS